MCPNPSTTKLLDTSNRDVYGHLLVSGKNAAADIIIFVQVQPDLSTLDDLSDFVSVRSSTSLLVGFSGAESWPQCI